MNKTLISISITTILFLAGLSTGLAVKNTPAIIYVDDDNISGPWLGTADFPYRYIQYAVENASDGDTIRVYEGVYANPCNNVYITKKLSIIGNGSDNTHVNRTVTISSNDVFFCGFTINGCDFRTGKETCCMRLEDVNDCYIKNNSMTTDLCGLELYNSHDNKIENNTIVDTKEDKPGIYVHSSNNNIISGNNFDSCEIGIYSDHCQNNIIDYNHFNCCNYSIYFIFSDFCKIINNIIEKGKAAVSICSNSNSTIIGNVIREFNEGLFISSSNRTSIINNHFLNNSVFGLKVDASKNIIYDNIFINNSWRGMSLTGSENVISGNYFLNNNGSGISMTGSYNTILDNTFLNNSGDGILLGSSCHHNTFTCNNFYNNEVGICYDYSSYSWDFSDNSRSDITRNNFSHNEVGIELENSSLYTITGNTISNNTYGIIMKGCKRNTISYNKISSNSYDGIIFYPIFRGVPWATVYHYPFRGNKIIRNIISNNGENGILLSDYGRYWNFRYCFSSRGNLILENNFVNNKKDAFIINAFFNRWYRNYWNQGRLLPITISGIFKITYIISKEIPWFSIDWRPALKKYDIEV